MKLISAAKLSPALDCSASSALQIRRYGFQVRVVVGDAMIPVKRAACRISRTEREGIKQLFPTTLQSLIVFTRATYRLVSGVETAQHLQWKNTRSSQAPSPCGLRRWLNSAEVASWRPPNIRPGHAIAVTTCSLWRGLRRHLVRTPYFELSPEPFAHKISRWPSGRAGS
jgi:predicted secreted hydrolase